MAEEKNKLSATLELAAIIMFVVPWTRYSPIFLMLITDLTEQLKKKNILIH